MKASWLDLTTSVFDCMCHNSGTPHTFREIFYSDLGPHKWSYPKNDTEWINGYSHDMTTISKIRTGEIDKTVGKKMLRAYTPSANFKSKKKGAEIMVHTNPILQLDFDHLESYDINEVKFAIFDSIPHVCCVSESVSGNGLFALLLIDDATKLREYAEHCFIYFKNMGLTLDPSKGRNYTDLRFISYDENPLLRENPVPLKVKNFYRHPVKQYNHATSFATKDNLVKWAINEIARSYQGNRDNTINKVCYTLGGHGVGLDEIIRAIANLPQYAGEENQFIEKAKRSFVRGSQKPLAA